MVFLAVILHYINSLHTRLDATMEMLVLTKKIFFGVDLKWQNQKTRIFAGPEMNSFKGI